MPQSTLLVRPGIGVCVPRALCVIGMGMVVAVVMPVSMPVSMAVAVPMAMTVPMPKAVIMPMTVRVAIRMGVAVVANMPMSRGRNRVRICKVDAFMAPWSKRVF